MKNMTWAALAVLVLAASAPAEVTYWLQNAADPDTPGLRLAVG